MKQQLEEGQNCIPHKMFCLKKKRRDTQSIYEEVTVEK